MFLNFSILKWIPWLLFVAGVFLMGFFDPYGGITLDGPWYLKQATFLLNGLGFNSLIPDYQYYQNYHYFFLWPPGYPLGIALISWLTSLKVWYSYKILNLLLYSWVYFTFSKKEQGPVFLLILSCSWFCDMAYQCWSDFPALMTSLIFINYLIIESRFSLKLLSILKIVLLYFVSVALRYQSGIIIIAFIPIIIQAMLNKEYSKFRNLLFVFFFLFISFLLFVYFNYHIHNKYPSLTRDSFNDIYKMFFIGLIKAFNFIFTPSIRFPGSLIFCLIVLMIFVIKIIKDKLLIIKIELYIYSLTSIAYLTITLLLSLNHAIGLGHERFYSVPLIFLSFGIVSSLNKIKFSSLLIFFSIILIAINYYAKPFYLNRINKGFIFSDRYLETEKRLKQYPEGSIVVFEDKWIEFIRPDLIGLSPYERSVGNIGLNFQTFLSKISGHKGSIYISVLDTNDIRILRYDTSVYNYMKKCSNSKIIKIK